MRQQLLAGAGFAQDQHRAARLRGAACLALDLDRRRAGAYETGEGVFGWSVASVLGDIQALALGGQFTPRVVQVALHQCELADQGLQRGFRMVEQHDADGTDHRILLIAQWYAADDKGAGAVGQQVDQVGLAGLQHAAHLRVRNHVLDHMAHELVK